MLFARLLSLRIPTVRGMQASEFSSRTDLPRIPLSKRPKYTFDEEAERSLPGWSWVREFLLHPYGAYGSFFPHGPELRPAAPCVRAESFSQIAESLSPAPSACYHCNVVFWCRVLTH